MMPRMIRKTVLYSGRVQGVGFRYATLTESRDHDVTGYVRNLEDGRVEVVVEGEREQVDAFLAGLSGRMGDYIDDVQQSENPTPGHFQNFEIRY
jgi:acylphosphatase